MFNTIYTKYVYARTHARARLRRRTRPVRARARTPIRREAALVRMQSRMCKRFGNLGAVAGRRARRLRRQSYA